VIVVDSNILAYLYLPGEHSASAEALLERDHEWAAPLLWRSEFRNILAGYLRRGALSFEQVIELQEEAEALLEGAEFAVDSINVLELVRDSKCSAYDYEFVALAKQLGTKLVTMDSKVLRAFPKHAVSLAGAKL
jgi:predicted nucleic acid-binding protein